MRGRLSGFVAQIFGEKLGGGGKWEGVSTGRYAAFKAHYFYLVLANGAAEAHFLTCYIYDHLYHEMGVMSKRKA